MHVSKNVFIIFIMGYLQLLLHVIPETDMDFSVVEKKNLFWLLDLQGFSILSVIDTRVFKETKKFHCVVQDTIPFISKVLAASPSHRLRLYVSKTSPSIIYFETVFISCLHCMLVMPQC